MPENNYPKLTPDYGAEQINRMGTDSCQRIWPLRYCENGFNGLAERMGTDLTDRNGWERIWGTDGNGFNGLAERI